ncbi:hypothetical protein B296_00042111, partial [Ensete ventricosum]
RTASAAIFFSSSAGSITLAASPSYCHHSQSQPQQQGLPTDRYPQPPLPRWNRSPETHILCFLRRRLAASTALPCRRRPLSPAATIKHTSSSPPLPPLLPAVAIPCYSLRHCYLLPQSLSPATAFAVPCCPQSLSIAFIVPYCRSHCLQPSSSPATIAATQPRPSSSGGQRLADRPPPVAASYFLLSSPAPPAAAHPLPSMVD